MRAKQLIARRQATLRGRLMTSSGPPLVASSLASVRRHPLLGIGGAGLAGVIAGRLVRASGAGAVRAVGGAASGAARMFAAAVLTSAVASGRRGS